MTTPNLDNPFAGSTPSVSFKDAPIGTTYEGIIIEPPELVQSRDFETSEPAYWPSKPGQQPNPKMAVVVKLSIDGEERALWAIKPSAMFAAIAGVAGTGLAVGGTLKVRYEGDKPNANPRLKAAKQYAARYTPPAAPATPDPFNGVDAAATDAKGWDASPPF